MCSYVGWKAYKVNFLWPLEFSAMYHIWVKRTGQNEDKLLLREPEIPDTDRSKVMTRRQKKR